MNCAVLPEFSNHHSDEVCITFLEKRKKTIKDRQNNHKSICYLHTRLSFLFFRSNFAARNVVLEQTFISGTLKTKYLTNYTASKTNMTSCIYFC